MPRSKVMRKTVNVTIPMEVDVQLDGDEWFAKLYFGLYGMSGSTEKEAIENAIRRSWPDARIEE